MYEPLGMHVSHSDCPETAMDHTIRTGNGLYEYLQTGRLHEYMLCTMLTTLMLVPCKLHRHTHMAYIILAQSIYGFTPSEDFIAQRLDPSSAQQIQGSKIYALRQKNT